MIASSTRNAKRSITESYQTTWENPNSARISRNWIERELYQFPDWWGGTVKLKCEAHKEEWICFLIVNPSYWEHLHLHFRFPFAISMIHHLSMIASSGNTRIPSFTSIKTRPLQCELETNNIWASETRAPFRIQFTVKRQPNKKKKKFSAVSWVSTFLLGSIVGMKEDGDVEWRPAPSGVEKVQAPPLSLSGNCKSATLPSPPLYNKTSPLQHQHYFLRGRASYNFVFCGIAYQGTINPFTLFLFLTKFLLKYLESYHT